MKYSTMPVFKTLTIAALVLLLGVLAVSATEPQNDVPLPPATTTSVVGADDAGIVLPFAHYRHHDDDRHGGNDDHHDDRNGGEAPHHEDAPANRGGGDDDKKGHDEEGHSKGGIFVLVGLVGVVCVVIAVIFYYCGKKCNAKDNVVMKFNSTGDDVKEVREIDGDVVENSGKPIEVVVNGNPVEGIVVTGNSDPCALPVTPSNAVAAQKEVEPFPAAEKKL